MRIHIIFSTCFLLFSLSVWAQEAKDISPILENQTNNLNIKKKWPMSHQVGFNGTTLLKQFLSVEDSSIVQSPYLLTYKFAVGPLALRTGIGGSMKSESVREEGYADSETNESFSVDARIGVEYQMMMGKRWQGSFGVDYIGFGGETRQISDTGFDKVTTTVQERGQGFGPAIGLRFAISEKFSLYTEGAIYYTQSERVRSRLFTNFPQFDDQLDEATVKDLRVWLPATIYLVYQF